MKGAHFGVLTGMLTSIGVIAAAAGIIIWTGTDCAAAEAARLGGDRFFIPPGSRTLLRDGRSGSSGTDSLPVVNLAPMRRGIGGVAGAAGVVHDLDVWSLTFGLNAMIFRVVFAYWSGRDTVLGYVRKKQR